MNLYSVYLTYVYYYIMYVIDTTHKILIKFIRKTGLLIRIFQNPVLMMCSSVLNKFLNELLNDWFNWKLDKIVPFFKSPLWPMSGEDYA